MSPRKVFTPASAPITYTDVPAYKPTTDFFASLESASSAVYKTANQYQINVLPDFTAIVMTIIFHANRLSSVLESPDHPKVSVYTFAAYCLNLVYAFFLIHDYELNFSVSPYAQDLMTHRHFERYYEHIQSLPVPPFLVTILAQLQQTLLNNQKTILFTPSFNGFSHYTHFGRFFPIDIFFGIHDLVATLNARANPADNHNEYQTRTVFTVTSLNITPFAPATNIADYHYTHSHFFASYFPTNTAAASNPQSANNRLTQFLSTIFNVQSLRNYQSRQRLSAIGLNTVTVPNGLYNPYVVMMSLTSNNISELRLVFDSVASVITEQKLATVNFSSTITQSTSKILIHGYSDFPLPTWNAHFTKNANPAAYNQVLPTPITPEAYATSLSFLRSFDPAAPLNTWTPRTHSIATFHTYLNAAALTALNAVAAARMSLRIRPVATPATIIPIADQTIDYAPPFPDPAELHHIPVPTNPVPNTPAAVTAANMELTDFNSFDAADSLFPQVKYLDSVDFSVSTCHLAGLAGLIIYSEELCASTVPMLSSLSSCSDDNNQFLQSAIPYSLTHLAIDFKTLGPIPSRAISRLASTALTQVCLTMFRRANVIYDSTLTETTFDLGLQHRNYGQRHVPDQSIPLYNQTFIGHNVSTGIQRSRNAPARFDPPATPTGHLLVWSPYSFVDATVNFETTTLADRLRRTHFVTNLRTLFGTSAHVYDATSIIDAMPAP